MIAALLHQVLATDSERTQLERAVVNRLRRLHRTAGGYLEFVGEYGGELEGVEDFEDAKTRLLGRRPAVLVTTGREGHTITSLDKLQARVSLEFDVIAVSGHLGSREARTQGADRQVANGDPGVYQILSDIRHYLMGRDLGLEKFSRPVPTVTVPNFRNEGFTAYTATYEVDYWIHQASLADVNLVTEVHHRHHLNESEPVNPVLTGESKL